jgi:hypothetical protein
LAYLTTSILKTPNAKARVSTPTEEPDRLDAQPPGRSDAAAGEIEALVGIEGGE